MAIFSQIRIFQIDQLNIGAFKLLFLITNYENN